jgi:hypothetical protein
MIFIIGKVCSLFKGPEHASLRTITPTDSQMEFTGPFFITGTWHTGMHTLKRVHSRRSIGGRKTLVASIPAWNAPSSARSHLNNSCQQHHTTPPETSGLLSRKYCSLQVLLGFTAASQPWFARSVLALSIASVCFESIVRSSASTTSSSPKLPENRTHVSPLIGSEP